MKYEVNTSLPITFEKSEEVVDSRFTKAKIWLAHTGKNLNGSIFTKDVLETMATNSLANIPILGYIELDEYNKADFQGHEMKLVISKDGMELVYMGKAIGLIPETNNYAFEKKVCSDGLEREWLVCDGLMWNKFSEAADIFERDGSKGQSMELEPGSIAGTFNKDGDFVFSAAKFEGACVLGDHVTPAMVSSVIEKYTMSTIKQQLQEMISELQAFQKGSDNVENPEIKVEEVFADAEEPVVVDPTPVVKPETATQFELTHMQIANELSSILREVKVEDDWGWTYSRYWYVDSDSEHVYAYDTTEDYRYYGFKYTVANDVATIDFESKFRVKIAYLPLGEGESFTANVIPQEFADAVAENKLEKNAKELTTKLEEKQTEFSTLETELQELRTYQLNKLKEEHNAELDELFTEFSAELSEDELAQVRTSLSDCPVEEIRESLFALVGKKKAKFTATPTKKQTLRIPLGGGDEQTNVGGKSWGHLVERTIGKRS